MKFIQDYKEGDRVSDIYLCKHKQLATTKMVSHTKLLCCRTNRHDRR